MYFTSKFFMMLFIVFSMLGTIKVYIGGNLNWFIQLTLLMFSLVTYLAENPKIMLKTVYGKLLLIVLYKKIFFGWLLFISGIIISSFINDLTGIYTIFKYLAFMFVLICLFIISISPKFFEKILVFTLVVSLAPLIILVLFRQLDAMVILGDGRMGWLASWPGVIWKIGAVVWPFSVWRYFKNPSLFNIILPSIAMLTIAIDGSRTGILWGAIVWIWLAIIAIFAQIYTKPILTNFFLLLIVYASFSLIQPALLDRVSGQTSQPTIQLPQETINERKEIAIERFVTGDYSIRLNMLYVGWQQALDKFPWGGGFGSTRIDDFGTNSVIHMSYLQLLADNGIFSLVGYLMFLLYPFCLGLRFVSEKREFFTKRFELMLTPLSILILFLFIGCFHPISNELTDWAIVLTAISILLNYVPYRS